MLHHRYINHQLDTNEPQSNNQFAPHTNCIFQLLQLSIRQLYCLRPFLCCSLIRTGKGKGTVHPEQAMKAQKLSRGTALLFL